MALPDDDTAIDEAPRDLRRRTKHQRRYRVRHRTGKIEGAHVECDDIRRHADSEMADVVAVEHLRAATRRQLQCFTRGHRRRAETDALKQHRLPGFRQQVPAIR